jgi:hypothetical protein
LEPRCQESRDKRSICPSGSRRRYRQCAEEKYLSDRLVLAVYRGTRTYVCARDHDESSM